MVKVTGRVTAVVFIGLCCARFPITPALPVQEDVATCSPLRHHTVCVCFISWDFFLLATPPLPPSPPPTYHKLFYCYKPNSLSVCTGTAVSSSWWCPTLFVPKTAQLIYFQHLTWQCTIYDMAQRQVEAPHLIIQRMNISNLMYKYFTDMTKILHSISLSVFTQSPSEEEVYYVVADTFSSSFLRHHVVFTCMHINQIWSAVCLFSYYL